MKQFNAYDMYAVKFPIDTPTKSWDNQRREMQKLGVVYAYAAGRHWHIKCPPEVLALLILKLGVIVQ